MDFDFSDDQQQLRDAVAKWVEKSYDFERRQKIVAAGGFDRGVYNELAELGLTGIYVSEDHGGMGMGPVEAMVVMEELGRGIVTEPLMQAFVTSAVIQAYGDDAVKSAWLPRIASGEALVVLAQQERKARYRLDLCEAKAAKSGDSYALTALKNIVPAGDAADAFVVPAMLDGKLALFIVERSAKSVSTRGYPTQDEARAADVKLDDAPATLITTDGQAALTFAVDVGIACVCAQGVGAMDQTLKLTTDYMNQRKQFGVTIATFQALRHRVAEMKMQLELARSMSYYATLKLNAPEAERRQALSRAKVQLGQSMRFVGQQSVQLHGGIGVTDEYAGSHYFKFLTQLEMTCGDTLHHLGEVSQHMTETAGVFA
ncbi:acyl-CoA dehydrogenase family protein [Ottowia testudinis]|uniref:Acyl-CoA dehydrogenase family protein n=1 Tax=Ottowia testudinis TaxID=2816950 RepID=A0A975CJ09_9BURK|nr:acyl-CoA dehydrogenase family protein [Ottowia testudinis]QTD46464.1 acyl-CoA dehydrogenase family protein [Ottowia testudinis]